MPGLEGDVLPLDPAEISQRRKERGPSDLFRRRGGANAQDPDPPDLPCLLPLGGAEAATEGTSRSLSAARNGDLATSSADGAAPTLRIPTHLTFPACCPSAARRPPQRVP